MSRARWLRRWAIGWAVLQLAVPPAVAYADVVVERESRTQVAHVESTSGIACRPLHTAECAFCQVVSRAAASADHACAPAILSAVRCPTPREGLAAASSPPGQRPPARAPPLR